MSVINQGGYSYVIHDSGNPGPLPLVVFLGGVGERGNITALENFIKSEFNNIAKAVNTGFILIAPLLPSGEWENHYVDAALDYATKALPIKTDQITIMGVSLGGGGVWKYISASIENAKKFNVAIPICGIGGWSNLKNVADAGLPVWAFHAADDKTVGVGNTHSAVDGINSFNPVIKAKKTIYPTGDHYIWARVCDPDKSPGIEGETVTIWQWMKQNTNTNHIAVMATSSSSSGALLGLTANAGPDQTITGNTANLDGSASTGYKNAWWALESFNGKWVNLDVFETNWGIKVKLKNLQPGEYVFKLTVDDVTGLAQSDTVKITARAATVTTPTTKILWAQVPLKSGKKLIVYEDDSTEVK